MRVAWKLILPLVLCVFAVLGTDAFLRVQREMAMFESEMAKDHHLLGRALGAAVSAALATSGPEQAAALVRAANEEGSGLGLRWVWLDVPAPHPDGPRAPPPELAALSQQREVSWLDGGPNGYLYTYVPVSGGARPAALEISESLAAEYAYVRGSMRDLLLNTGAIALGGGLLTMLLGLALVGRPLQRLAEQARRIGAGDLGVRLPATARDEIGSLGREMNRMGEQLEQATRARAEALEQLRHADRLSTVGKLAAGIAHELGTPLNVIAARAKQVRTGAFQGDKARSAAEIIETQCRDMTRIIRQLLDFARPRPARRVPMQDLGELARGTLEALAPLAGTRGVALRFRGATPLHASVDPGQVRQVLVNLVMNAVQASPRNEHVTVTLDQVDAAPPSSPGAPPTPCARVTVEDRGPGIPADVRARLFEPFFTTKDVGEGTGLGLSVAHGLAQEHGGWIAVDSEPGRGSRFSLLLPRRESPSPFIPLTGERPAASPLPGGTT